MGRLSAHERRKSIAIRLCGACLFPVLSAAFLSACGGTSWNNVRTARADAEITHMDAGLERHRRAIAGREASKQEFEDRLAALEQDLSAARKVQRLKAAALSRELATLAAVEQDLEAAKLRQQAVEKELTGVRELEAQLARREQRIQELTGAIAAREEEVRKLTEQDLAAETAAAIVRADLAARAVRIAELDAAIRAALEASDGLPPKPETEPALEPGTEPGTEPAPAGDDKPPKKDQPAGDGKPAEEGKPAGK